MTQSNRLSLIAVPILWVLWSLTPIPVAEFLVPQALWVFGTAVRVLQGSWIDGVLTLLLFAMLGISLCAFYGKSATFPRVLSVAFPLFDLIVSVHHRWWYAQQQSSRPIGFAELFLFWPRYLIWAVCAILLIASLAQGAARFSQRRAAPQSGSENCDEQAD